MKTNSWLGVIIIVAMGMFFIGFSTLIASIKHNCAAYTKTGAWHWISDVPRYRIVNGELERIDIEGDVPNEDEIAPSLPPSFSPVKPSKF